LQWDAGTVRITSWQQKEFAMSLKWLLPLGIAFGVFVAPEVRADATLPSRIISGFWSEGIPGDGGQCLDVRKSSTSPGAELILHGCHNGDNQSFRLKDQSLDSSRIAVYSGGKELCVGYTYKDGWQKVVTTGCGSAPAWKVRSDGKIQILDTPPSVETCLEVQPYFRFMIVMSCHLAVANLGANWSLPPRQQGPLYAPHNMRSVFNPNECLDVLKQSRNPGTPVLHFRCHTPRTSGQTFQLWGEIGQAMLSVYQGREMLCISNLGTHKIRTVPCNPADLRQRWNMASGNGFELTNYYTQRCLDASRSSRDAITWPCNGVALNQRWIF
jgi:hypothetical protein